MGCHRLLREDGTPSVKNDDGNSRRPQAVRVDEALYCRWEAVRRGAWWSVLKQPDDGARGECVERGETARWLSQRRMPLSVLPLHPGSKHQLLPH